MNEKISEHSQNAHTIAISVFGNRVKNELSTWLPTMTHVMSPLGPRIQIHSLSIEEQSFGSLKVKND